MSSESLFTRDEVLGGLPVQRARTVLFLIESRTGLLVDRSRRAMQRFTSEESSQERELAFIEAFAASRHPSAQPAIQDLERFAGDWANLVPESPNVRAVLAHVLADKYKFTEQAIPGIRQNLGLDEPAVLSAYQRQYQQPLEGIYVAEFGLRESLRWSWARFATRLETLPPFWTAFALTLTETVGVGIMALPIALAGIGPFAGLFLLVLLGLVNMVTIAYMAEAVSRSGNIRYGKAFFGRLVADFLGRDASVILSIALVLIYFIALLTYYIGLSTTMDAATSLPAPIWLAALFVVDLYFLRRQTLNAAVSAALVVGAVNLAVILILASLAIPWITLENITFIDIPFVGGRPFKPAILQLVFGVILSAYFGHTSMGNCAKVVLRRDPSGRSLIKGSLLAQLAALLIYSVWLLAVNGTLPAEKLIDISGTAMIPLAERVGPIVHVFGSIFILLGMGMGSVHYSLGFFNLVQEWLPKKHKPLITLLRRRGGLIFQMPGDLTGMPRLGLVYLGIEFGQPHFRWDAQTEGRVYRLETAGNEQTELKKWLQRLPGFNQRWLNLELEIQEANTALARLRISTALSLTYQDGWDTSGLETTSLAELPPNQRALLTQVVRLGEASLAELAESLNQDGRQIQQHLDRLVDQGSVRVVDTPDGQRYKAQLALKRGRQLPGSIWAALGETQPLAEQENLKQSGLVGAYLRAENTLLSETGRFILGVLPLTSIFLLTEWLVLTGAESFSRPISFLGVIIVSLLGGIFPTLLLIASRRKGEYVPGSFYRFLGNPILTGFVYLFSLSNLFLHGLVIWNNPFEQGVALLVGSLMLVMPLLLIRRKVFARRAVIEVRQALAHSSRTEFSVTIAGEHHPAVLQLEYPDSWQELFSASGELPHFERLRSLAFTLPPGEYRDLKVWSHRLNPAEETESLPAFLEIKVADHQSRLDLNLFKGQAVIDMDALPRESHVSAQLRFGTLASEAVQNLSKEAQE